MQTILDTDIHLDGGIRLWRNAVRIYPKVLFADDILDTPRHGGADVVAEADIYAIVRLVLLLDILEIKGEGLWMLEVARSSEFLAEREEVVVVALVEEEFYMMG